MNALTLITPMRQYPTPASGFHLLYEQVAEPNTAQGEDGPDGLIRRYEYVYGKAIVFGAGFKHSTEPGRSHGDEPQSYALLHIRQRQAGAVAPHLTDN